MKSDEQLKYKFTRVSSYADTVTLDQDGRKVKPEPITFNWWTILKCVLTLKHFSGGVSQDTEGNWRCRRCQRRVSI